MEHYLDRGVCLLAELYPCVQKLGGKFTETFPFTKVNISEIQSGKKKSSIISGDSVEQTLKSAVPSTLLL